MGTAAYLRAAELYRLGLAQHTNEQLARELSYLMASCLVRAGQFTEGAAAYRSLIFDLPQQDPRFAELSADHADALLTAALVVGQQPSTEEVLECARWLDADPEEVAGLGGARQHGLALLRLAQHRPDAAIDSCLRCIEWLENTEPDIDEAADREINYGLTVATLVIAYARSGDSDRAADWFSRVPAGNPLYEAAAAAVLTATS